MPPESSGARERIRQAGIYFGIVADGPETEAALSHPSEPRYTGWRALVSEAAFGVAWTAVALIFQSLGVALFIAGMWLIAVLARSQWAAPARRRIRKVMEQTTFVACIASSVIGFGDAPLARILIAVLVGGAFLLATAWILDRFEPPLGGAGPAAPGGSSTGNTSSRSAR